MPYGGVYRRDPWTTWTRPPNPPYTIPTAAYDRAASSRNQPRNRVFALARRGKFFYAPFNGLSLEQAVVPEFNGRPTNRSPLPTRRGKFFFAPFNGLSLEQAVVPEFNNQARNRWTFALARRGKFFPIRMVGFAPGQLDTPPFIRQRRRPQLPVRRGFVFAAPFPVAVVTTQVLPLIRQSRRPQLPAPRSRSWEPPFLADRSLVPDRITSRRARAYIPRRGLFVEFPLVGLAPGQFVVPDRIDSQRPRTYTARRGHFIQFAPPQVVVTPPGSQALPPQWIIPANRRRTFTLARRGRFEFAPFNGRSLEQDPPPQFIVARRRPVPVLARRGDFQPVPLVSPEVVTFRRSRRAFGARVLPRRAFQPVPLAASPVPQRRSDNTRRTARGVFVRRGHFQQLPVSTVSVDDGFFNFFG